MSANFRANSCIPNPYPPPPNSAPFPHRATSFFIVQFPEPLDCGPRSLSPLNKIVPYAHLPSCSPFSTVFSASLSCPSRPITVACLRMHRNREGARRSTFLIDKIYSQRGSRQFLFFFGPSCLSYVVVLGGLP